MSRSGRQGNADAAIETFRDLIRRRPNDIHTHRARLELAEMQLDRGNGDEAVELAETVIENVVDETAARAQYLIGLKYYNEENFQRAQDEFMRLTILYKNYEEWVVPRPYHDCTLSCSNGKSW